MKLIKENILEYQNLIERCIGGDSDALMKFFPKVGALDAVEIAAYITHFKDNELYHHVHALACTLLDKNQELALEFLIHNGEHFSASYFQVGRYYYYVYDYHTAETYYKKGWEQNNAFCGKGLTDIYRKRGIWGRSRSVCIKFVLIFKLFFVSREGANRVRYIYEHF